MRHPILKIHKVRSPRWQGETVRIAVMCDLHVVAPWASLKMLGTVVDQVMGLAPDVIMIPGDFLAEWKLPGRKASAAEIVGVLGRLSAPLGVHATLGNHDWKDCALAQQTQNQRNSVAEALEASDIHYYANAARDMGPFWVAGVDSMTRTKTSGVWAPRHNVSAALADVPDGADVILLAHEPDIWVLDRPDVALTVSGHTHGGQIALGRWKPLTPSRFGSAYAHGLFWDGDRAMVVSGGLGYTAVPFRLNCPAEITMIELSSA